MKILLSPAKKQNNNGFHKCVNNPHFINKATELMDILRNYSEEELTEVLSISNNLSRETYLKNQVWRSNPDINLGTNALFSFNGEAFNFLNPTDFTDEDLIYANDHLRIFSGLYGILKPLDTIMPYRLDIKNSINGKNNLYDFWSEDLTNYLIEDFKSCKDQYLLNLSSKEYYSAIDFKKIPGEVITPEFKIETNGKLKTVAIWAKRMRGLLAYEVIKNRVTTENALIKVNLEGFKLEDVKDGSYLYIKR